MKHNSRINEKQMYIQIKETFRKVIFIVLLVCILNLNNTINVIYPLWKNLVNPIIRLNTIDKQINNRSIYY